MADKLNRPPTVVEDETVFRLDPGPLDEYVLRYRSVLAADSGHTWHDGKKNIA